jgi:hypothetical protein
VEIADILCESVTLITVKYGADIMGTELTGSVVTAKGEKTMELIDGDFFTEEYYKWREEAEPVRRGEWGLLYGTYGPMVCSECGGEAPTVLMGSEYKESQYCPTCGAKMKMDGGEKK